MTRHVGWTAAAAALVLCASSNTFAAEPEPEPTASPDKSAARRAVDMGHHALESFDAKQFRRALAELQAAEALQHSSVFVLYIARCQRRLGTLLDARESYRRVIAERLTADAPLAKQRARAEAQTELGSLEPLIPSLQARVRGPGTLVLLDGKAIEPGRIVEVDPGAHVLEASHEGHTARRTVTMREGDRNVVVDLDVSPPKGEAERQWPTGAYVTGTLGVSALGVGVAMGIATLAEASAIRSRCGPDDACHHSLEARGDQAEMFGNVATASLVASGILLAGTVAWILLDDPAPSSSTTGTRFGVDARGAALRF